MPVNWSSRCKEFWAASKEAKGEQARLAAYCVKVGVWPGDKENCFAGWAKWSNSSTENSVRLELHEGKFEVSEWKYRTAESDPIAMRNAPWELPEEEIKYLEKIFRATIEDENAPVIWH